MNINENMPSVNIAYNPEKDLWIAEYDDRIIEVDSPMATKHFNTPNCTCRPIFIPWANTILVAGEDDCPTHGFARCEHCPGGEDCPVQFCSHVTMPD